MSIGAGPDEVDEGVIISFLLFFSFLLDGTDFDTGERASTENEG